MRLYIWNYLESLTENYHSGGGLVICTDRSYDQVWLEIKPAGEDSQGDAFPTQLPEPDHMIEVSEGTEAFYEIFPDTGCC